MSRTGHTLFELSIDSTTLRRGDVVSGRAVAVADARQEMLIELVFNDQSGVAETASSLTVDGVAAGTQVPFEFVLPDDALSGYESTRAQIGWAVQARFASARHTHQRDILFLDVDGRRPPDGDLPPRDMRRGPETVGFMGRGKKTEKWDVHAHLASAEVARGGEARIEILTTSTDLDRRGVEVGLICYEHWMQPGRHGESGTRRTEVIHAQFQRVAEPGPGVSSVVVPADGPFSWHRSPLEDEIIHRTAGFTWLAVVREDHPDKGPQKQAELTVLP